jgi:hypothetical protein
MADSDGFDALSKPSEPENAFLAVVDSQLPNLIVPSACSSFGSSVKPQFKEHWDFSMLGAAVGSGCEGVATGGFRIMCEKSLGLKATLLD